MFKLLWSELRYSKIFYILTCCIFLILFTRTMLDNSYNYSGVYSFMVNSTIFFFLMLSIGCILGARENRKRFYYLLPVSVKTIAKLNLLFLILFNAFIFILWVIVYLAKYTHQAPGLIWAMISFSMHIFIIFGIGATGCEIGSNFVRFRHIINLFSIICSIALVIFNVNIIIHAYLETDIKSPLLKTYISLTKSPSGALILSLAAGVLLYLIYRLYIRRRYHLE